MTTLTRLDRAAAEEPPTPTDASSTPSQAETGPLRLAARARRPGTAIATELPRRTKPYVVLLVDDEEDILESLRAAHEGTLEQVQVRTAASGLEALRILGSVPVDLVVTDFKMPGMDGFELLERAERIAPGLPRILMTAFVYDAPQASVERSHVDWFLPKPFKAEELLRAIATTLASANQPPFSVRDPSRGGRWPRASWGP